MHKKGGDEDKLSRVKQRQPFKGPHQRKGEMQSKRKGRDEQCLPYGNHRHKTREECPALGKEFDFCKKTGHFAKAYFKKLASKKSLTKVIPTEPIVMSR